MPSPSITRSRAAGSYAGRAPFRIADLAAGQELGRVHVDAAEGAELAAEGLQRLAVDQQDLEPLIVSVDADGAVTVVRVEVLEPCVRRLENVAVGVYDPRRHYVPSTL